MAHDVFISHSTRDKAVSDAICAALENDGLRCWVAPRDVQPGRSFAGEITRAIQQSKAMVLVFSANSNNSEQVLREVQLAVTAHLHIIQFRIEDVGLNDDLRYYLSTPHWLDALTPPLEKHLGSLTIAVRKLLNPAENEPSETATRPSRPSVVSAPAKGQRAYWLIIVVALVILSGGLLFLRFKPNNATRPAGAQTTVNQPPEKPASKPANDETVVSFAQVDTGSMAPFTVAAAPYLRQSGISVVEVRPAGSEVVLVNNRGLYEGKGVFPTVSQNFLTEVNTKNEPASFTLRLSTPAQSVTFLRPRLYPYTESGITHPAWSAHALDASGNELSSQSESITRRLPSRDGGTEDDVPAQPYTLRAPGFAPIAAVRFDSDPRLNGRPFAAFSTLLIEQVTFVPAK
jgi:TIR domain-containing protein